MKRPSRLVTCAGLAGMRPVVPGVWQDVRPADALSDSVDRMQRNFEPMRRRVDVWKDLQLPETYAKLVIYRAFVEEEPRCSEARTWALLGAQI